MQSKSDCTHVLKLSPGQDIKASLEQYANGQAIQAGWIVTCAGSLTSYNIRFANKPTGSTGSGHFEIINLSGTLSAGGCHIHICIAGPTGRTIGGHLLHGCIIHTTAEIIITQSNHYVFKRENDGSTRWKELQISKIV